MSTAAARNALDGSNTKRTVQVDSSGIEWTRVLPQTPITGTGVMIAAGGATAMSSTLAAASGKTTYISGFSIGGLGSTLGEGHNVTVTGLVTGTQNFFVGVPTGVLVPVSPLNVVFNPALPASVPSAAIVVSVSAFGSGSTAASLSAWGYQA